MKRYPVIVFVYGEPASQTVVDRWGGNRMLFHRALAEAGYIVLSVDNRGTPAPKGAAWRKIVYGTVGDLSSREQQSAINALAARYAFIDRARIGIWGWSGGGSTRSTRCFAFPTRSTSVWQSRPCRINGSTTRSIRSVTWAFPGTTERATGWAHRSISQRALKASFSWFTVTGDDNVHAQGTERLVNRLIELGKPFDLMMYPNRTHAIAEGNGTTAHVYRLVARYFLRTFRGRHRTAF